MMENMHTHRGEISYHAGLSAEEQVSNLYERRGFAIREQRWRGQGGEVDLITENSDGLVFIEVKQSRSFDSAVQKLRPRQMQRIYASAEEYLGQMPNGSLTEVRFDVALVNGQGDVKIIENAFGHC